MALHPCLCPACFLPLPRGPLVTADGVAVCRFCAPPGVELQPCSLLAELAETLFPAALAPSLGLHERVHAGKAKELLDSGAFAGPVAEALAVRIAVDAGDAALLAACDQLSAAVVVARGQIALWQSDAEFGPGRLEAVASALAVGDPYASVLPWVAQARRAVDGLPAPPLPASMALVGESGTALSVDQLDCGICLGIFVDPVTTVCGHTFCRHCLVRTIDHTNKCPSCRAKLGGDESHIAVERDPTTRPIEAVARMAFPDALAERTAEVERLEQEAATRIPLFDCTVLYPGMPMPLHIFEPRYRLMLRRVLARPVESRHFGMTASTGEGPAEFGTLARITDSTLLPDGRSLIQVVGGRRFRVDMDTVEIQDGYHVGKIELLDEEELGPEDLEGDRAAAISKVRKDLETAVVEIRDMVARRSPTDVAELPEIDPEWTDAQRIYWFFSIIPVPMTHKYAVLSLDLATRFELVQAVLPAVMRAIAEQATEGGEDENDDDM